MHAMTLCPACSETDSKIHGCHMNGTLQMTRFDGCGTWAPYRRTAGGCHC